MPNLEENFVGLFIDWDNLAISTAVDFGGAVPDVRAIVKAAQRFGTVLVARAYAEWNVSSERLSVYRVGIEPVYAPTFRFEPEVGNAGSRGKSLADPCLVTDCIDTLHLMPEINVFVLVSGDKDLIPIVRLAQLRGKRVVVIGPDYAAAILRDMADEYIPYRQLAEASENPPTEVSLHGVKSHRRGPTPNHRPVTPPVPATPRQQSAPRLAPVPAAAVPTPPEQSGNGSPQPLAVGEPEVAAGPLPAEELLDTAPLFSVIATILKEREEAGKPRLRATNLKDQLLARITGFNERKYGFARFKDLLNAAEKAGVLVVSRTGPVQWVAAAGQPVSDEPATTLGAPPMAEAAPETPEAAAPTDDADTEVVRFILGLRERSRWLTYTYVLTNLLNHLGHGVADAASDAEARATLNRLVQSGVLVVDREPREIDVNGTRHRVRLCHVVDEHPLVQRVAEELSREAAAEQLGPGEAAELTSAPAEDAPAGRDGSDSPESAAEAGGLPSAWTEPAGARSADEANSETSLRAQPRPDQSGGSGPATTEEAGVVPGTSDRPAEPADWSGPVGSAEAASETLPSDQAGGSPAAPEAATVDEGQAAATLSLTDSFAVLQAVVRDATDASRPTTGPAAVKNRLVRRLGGFDERAYGFSKFKDYLISAERAGAIRLEISGNSTRVALAGSEGDQPSP